jgi:hypothetical protein
MLESLSARLCEPGGVHYGSPDKRPEARLETVRLAGELSVPFTTGILASGPASPNKVSSMRSPGHTASCRRAVVGQARSVLRPSQKYLKFQHQPMCVN